MGVKLVSSSGGSVELNAPVTASNYTATMPAVTGTVVVADANGNPTLNGAMMFYPQTINANITTADNTNALSCGPITIATSFSVTIGNNSYWTIV